MKNFITLSLLCLSASAFALNVSHFTITRITAPYFIIDGNSPSTLTKAYVGFEVKNNSNSATTYSGLQFTITSIATNVVGQNYAVVSPVSSIVLVGTLAPGETKVCYYYVSYPANATPQATFNVQLSDNTASWKTQSFVIYNRSSISANAGGAATQTFTNQDLIGGTILDDVTYAVGNVQNGDESDFQVAVSPQFDPTKITLMSTRVISSTVPGIVAGATDSLYFVTGNGSTGATITMRWTFRITGTNFTTYLLPCAGSTSGSTNYKYALNTSLGQGSPITVSSAANPLTITKTSDNTTYGVNTTAIFTVTINNPGAYGITIDKITDEIPAGFTYQALHGTSQVTVANSTTVPSTGATGTITFNGGVLSGGNNSYYVPAGGSIILKYTATTSSTFASNLLTTARDYVAATEVGSAQNTVSVTAPLPVSLLSFNAAWQNEMVKLNWSTASENNSRIIEIERSNGNVLFTKIGELPAAGTSVAVQSYYFIDSFSTAGKNEYRLKLMDRDGQFKYSPIVSINKKQTGVTLLNSYPNPFVNELNIQVASDKNQAVQVRLSDMIGNTIVTTTQTCIRGTSTISLNKLGSLPAGNYLLQVITMDGQQHQKLVKVR